MLAVNLTKITRKLHLYLAVISALFILNISLTGTLLVFAKELQQYFQPQYWLVTPQTQMLDVDTLIQRVEKNSQQKIKQLRLAPLADQAWQVHLTNGYRLSINPYSAEILYQYYPTQSFYGFVLAWHRWLLWQTPSGEKPLQVIVASVSLLLILECLLGFLIWLRPKKPLQRLKIRFTAKTKVLVYQLHSVLGVSALIPLILIAFTGLAFFWQNPSKIVLETLLQSKIASVSKLKMSEQYSLALPKQQNLNQAIKQGEKVFPQGKLYQINLPFKQQPLKLRYKMPSEYHPFSWLFLDRNNQILQRYDASQQNLATRVWYFKYNFHIGDFAGVASKVLWLLFALLPCFFVLSGCWLFFARRKKPCKR